MHVSINNRKLVLPCGLVASTVDKTTVVFDEIVNRESNVLNKED